MKRFILLSLFLALMLGLVYLLATSRQQKSDPLELLPRAPLLVLDWKNPAAAIRTVTGSRFGRSLHAIDWPTVVDELGLPATIREGIRTQVAGLAGFIKHPLFQELFSRRVVVCLLPVESASMAGNLRQVLREHLLILVTPKSERLTSGMSAFQAGFRSSVASSVHQGVVVTENIMGGKTLFVASVGGQLAISPARSPVEQTIDLFLNRLVRKRSGLLLNSSYTSLKARGKGDDDFFLYADLGRMKSLLRDPQPRHDRVPDPPVKHGSGVGQMALFHQSHEQVHRFTSVVQFDPDQLAPFQHTIYSRKPLENRRIRNMPAKLLLYFWSNWLDLSGWWQKALARATEEEMAIAEEISTWVEQQAGMNFDQFLKLFGREFGMNVAEIRTSSFIPIPRICWCVELTDRSRVEKLLEALIAGLPVRRDMVAGVPIISILAGGGLMQPSFAFLDTNLVVADSREQIESLLRVGSQRLVQDEAFQAVDMGLDRPSNLVVFARTAKLVDGLKEFASWAGTIIAIRDETAGAKSKVIVDGLILPVLDGLTLFRAQSVRSYTRPGEVVLKSSVWLGEPEEKGEAAQRPVLK